MVKKLFLAVLGIREIEETYGVETALILLCCRLSLGTCLPGEVIAYTENRPVDWDRFSRLAYLQQVRPVVVKVLLDLGIPFPQNERSRRDYLALSAKSWKLAIETERLILLLNKHGVEVLPYKGAAFSKQFYGDLVSRESNDIDLVIRREQLRKGIEVLATDGYSARSKKTLDFLGDRFFSYYKDLSLDAFSGDTRTFHVELHWSLVENDVGLDTGVDRFLYQEGDALALAKDPVTVIDPVAHFSAVFIHHALKDTFQSLKNILDIGRGLQHPSVEQAKDHLRETFASLHLKRSLALGDILSHRLLGVSLGFRHSCAVPRAVSDHFLRQACGGKLLPREQGSGMVVWNRNRALLRDSFALKLRFYARCVRSRFVPADTDFLTVQWPGRLFFLYYVLKPVRSLLRPYRRAAPGGARSSGVNAKEGRRS